MANTPVPGPALSQQECTTINIGDDGQPRLVSPRSSYPAISIVPANTSQISYLSSGQGFVWNPEIFIPSYMDCEYTPLDHRREPVHEIVLSDDDIKKMLPQ